MQKIRWILLIPTAATAAILLGIMWGKCFPSAYFAKDNFRHVLLGVGPLFLGRLLPVATFVWLGSAIAPRRGRGLIALLGLLGGVFGWPFGTQYYVNPAAIEFYRVEVVGTIVGSAIGMLIAFFLWGDKKTNPIS